MTDQATKVIDRINTHPMSSGAWLLDKTGAGRIDVLGFTCDRTKGDKWNLRLFDFGVQRRPVEVFKGISKSDLLNEIDSYFTPVLR